MQCSEMYMMASQVGPDGPPHAQLPSAVQWRASCAYSAEKESATSAGDAVRPGGDGAVGRGRRRHGSVGHDVAGSAANLISPNDTDWMCRGWRWDPYRFGVIGEAAAESDGVDGVSIEIQGAAPGPTGFTAMVRSRACEGVESPSRYRVKAQEQLYKLVMAKQYLFLCGGYEF